MKCRAWLVWPLGMFVIFFPLLGSGTAWEPQKPVEFVIPAGPGGGADVMARFIAPLVSKYNLSPQPLLPSTNRQVLVRKGFSTSRK